MKEKGLLIVLSGFSGAGKGTMMKRLLELHPEDYALSISATTREPREGEEEGKNYFFKTKEKFLDMIDNDALLEYAQYVDNFYGTPKAYVEEQLNNCKNVILEIEIQGALKVKNQLPDTLLLFVTPPSAKILVNRLVGRGTETADVIHSRLSRAVDEADGIEAYDYLIINDALDPSVEELHRIITAVRSECITDAVECRLMSRNTGTVETIKNELRDYLKGDK